MPGNGLREVALGVRIFGTIVALHIHANVELGTLQKGLEQERLGQRSEPAWWWPGSVRLALADSGDSITTRIFPDPKTSDPPSVLG